ncbi:hypothetical protein Bestia_00008 [Acinetobacter phage Bestia]|nr:hypothetical protein Bestia_00008 [Acinetobacter phage Bestia]
MLFKLILLVTLNGNIYSDIVDYDLTREDCISQMLYVNSKLKNDSIEYICQGESE